MARLALSRGFGARGLGDHVGALRCLEDALEHAQRSGVVELERDAHYALASAQVVAEASWLARGHFELARTLDMRCQEGLPDELALSYSRHPTLEGWRRAAEELEDRLGGR